MAKYKTIKTISQESTTLALKRREDKNYYCVVWRHKRPESKTNRRFYLEKSSFWSIRADLAFAMLNEANNSNLLSPSYFRWPDQEIRVLDTAELGDSEKQILINETLVKSIEDQAWRNCNDLRIVACCEPPKYNWRKVMIVSKNKNLITFRSLTLDISYKHIYKKFDLQNSWKLDQSMMEADVKTHRIYFEILSKIYKSH